MMQRTKIVAEDSREAMARIMRDFGEDAVILSTRNVPGGIEIVAGHPAKGTPKFDVDDEEPTLARLKKAQKKQQADVIAERTSDVLKKTGTSKSASQKFADILLESGTTAPLPHAEGILYDQHQCNDKQQPQQPSAIGLCVNPLAIADAEDRRADGDDGERQGHGPLRPGDAPVQREYHHLRGFADGETKIQRLHEHHADRKSTRLNSSHIPLSRMPSSA